MHVTEPCNPIQDQLAANYDESPVLEAADDPHRLARTFLKAHCNHRDGRTLHYRCGEWLRWATDRYHPVSDSQLQAELTASIKTEFNRINAAELKVWVPSKERPNAPMCRKVTGVLSANVANALRSLSNLPGASMPCWIGDNGPFPADEFLPTVNGLLHVSALKSPTLMEATPRFLSVNALPVRYDAYAPRPMKWLAFISQLWPDDPESVGLLQEMIGVCLFPETRHQKGFIIIGPPRSGKGTIARVLRALVGEQNTVAPTLTSLSDRFGLQPLLGKTVAILSDCRLSNRSDGTAITERLLSISGEDALTVERKNRDAVTVKLATRFVILTNELPTLSDSSRALANRFMILRMTHSWIGRENNKLTDELLLELPGILNWSLEGWKRLVERGRFQQPASSLELVANLEDISSPVSSFVEDCCTVAPEQESNPVEMYEAWGRWCEARRMSPSSTTVFGRDLHAAVPTIRTPRLKEDGKRRRIYRGIGLIVGDTGPIGP